MKNLDSIVQEIKNINPETLEGHGVISRAKTFVNGHPTYICPACGNGTGKTGDGIVFQDKGGVWLAKCFKCGKGFDNFNLLAAHYGLDTHADFAEICKRAAADFSLSTDSVRLKEKSPAHQDAQEQKEIALVKADIAEAKINLPNFIQNNGGSWRGLSLETLQFFNCGYLPDWKSTKKRLAGTFATPTPRVIIPSGNHYLARLTVPVETFPADVQKYIHPKQHVGKKSLFGAVTITDKTEIIYVFEGEIDAMSAWQAYQAYKDTITEKDYFKGVAAFVATGGAGENYWHAEIDSICKSFNIKPRFKIYFDNDDAGRNGAQKACTELLKLGYLAVSETFVDYNVEEIYDANFILNETSEEFLAYKILSTFSDEEKFAAAQAELDKLQAARLAQEQIKKAADKAAKEKDILQKMFALPQSDMFNAERLYLFGGDKIRFLKDNEHWGIFNSGVWTFPSKNNSTLYSLARDMTLFVDKNRPKMNFITGKDGSIIQDPNTPPPNVETVAVGESLFRKLQQRKTQSNAIELLKGISKISITHADLDKNPMLLNVKNGVIDLETGKLMQAAPELLLTKQCNAAFIPTARAPVFEKFIQDILPDEMTRRAVLRYLGYCLTGSVNEEKALFVWGRGGNGKGTLFQTILKLFGSYGTSFNIHALLKAKIPKDGEAPTTEFVKLEGVRIAVAEEIPKNAEFDVAKFKNTTAGDPIPIRPLFQPARVIENPTHKFIFSGNDLPKAETAHDDGFNRRLLVAKFLQQFTGDNADLTLKKRIESPAELSGILNLLIAECLEWQKPKAQGGGLLQSPAMKEEKRSYITDNDWLAAFIEDECELGENYSVTRKALIEALKKSSKPARIFSDRQLTDMIKTLEGINYRRTGQNGVYSFFGIQLINSDIDVPFN